MTAPLSTADLANLRASISALWPACAEAQGVRGYTEVSLRSGLDIWASAVNAPDGAVPRAVEGLSRILEDAGYAIERRGSVRIVTGWATLMSGRRIADMPPCDRVRDAYHTGLSLGRAARDRAAREGVIESAKYRHAVNVGEMVRRIRVP